MTRTKKRNEIVLIGKEILIQNLITEEYEITIPSIKVPHGNPKGKEVLLSSQTKEIDKFKLTEIPKEKIQSLRDSGKPGFILKEEGKYFYAKINKSLRFVNSEIIGTHKCANCSHLSALPDELGGCQKVRKCSCKIEQFDFITWGYESFNTSQDTFTVIRCSRYEPYPYVEKKKPVEKTKKYYKKKTSKYTKI